MQTSLQYAAMNTTSRPSLAEWLLDVDRREDFRGKHVLVIFGAHFGVLLDDQYLCSASGGRPVHLAESAWLRARLCGWIVVDVLPEQAPEPAVEDIETMKARREAKRLAIEYGLQIEQSMCGEDATFTIIPPRWLSSRYDPHQRDHVRHAWREVLTLVRDYAPVKLVRFMNQHAIDATR